MDGPRSRALAILAATTDAAPAARRPPSARWRTGWQTTSLPSLLAVACLFATSSAKAEPLAPPPERPSFAGSARAPTPPAAHAADAYRDQLLARQAWAMTALGGWGAGSVVAGAGLWSTGRTPFVRAVGVQQVAWGAVDLAIAAFSYRGIYADRRRHEPLVFWERERRKLRTVLAVNIVLDVLYVGTGAALARFGQRETVRGAGTGVLPQGAFLLVFDSAFLLSL